MRQAFGAAVRPAGLFLRGSAMRALVRVGLRRPCTFVVLALLIRISGPLAVRGRSILVPGIGVFWDCAGPLPDPMAVRISSLFERVLGTAVNDAERIGAEPPQTSIVHVGGMRPVLKNGSASSTASSRRAALPERLRTDSVGDKARSSCTRRSAVRRAKTASRRRFRAS